MRNALYLPPQPNELWALALQMGVTDAVSRLPQSARPTPANWDMLPEAGPDDPLAWDFQSLLHLKQRFADAGLNVAVIEDEPPLDRARLGLPGRDEQIEAFCDLIANMGAAGIPVLCYNWMAGFSWQRTSSTARTRGGALTTRYQHALMRDAPLTEVGHVGEDQLWDSYAYFMQRVVPVAERAGVRLGLHPDDPPLSPIRGVARIFRSVEAFDRAMALIPSDYSGVTLCQGTFATMGANIPETIRHFGSKIAFVHFRDIRGTVEDYAETFQDDGQTNMLEAMRCYKKIGFSGVMRPDHVPTMQGDANTSPGYTTRGRIFAIGYMTGLMEAVRAESCGCAAPPGRARGDRDG
jgi:mannonate dehydratase